MKKEIKRAESFIRRDVELVQIAVRIPPELKAEAEMASERVDTSMNRFIEAALTWYIQKLKEEGSI
jgi:predicted HicB family RNase H-like nuclease